MESESVYIVQNAIPSIKIKISSEDLEIIKNKTVVECTDILRKYALPGSGFRLATESGGVRYSYENILKNGNILYYIMDSIDLKEIRSVFGTYKDYLKLEGSMSYHRHDIKYLGVYYHTIEFKAKTDKLSDIQSKMGAGHIGDNYYIPFTYSSQDDYPKIMMGDRSFKAEN